MATTKEENANAYATTFGTRKSLETEYAPVVSEKIRTVLAAKFGEPTSVERLDEPWFAVVDPKQSQNRWVRGAPDVQASVPGKDERLYIELKIKNDEYHKTERGGETRHGSQVPNYGVASYYLDDYVVRQMNQFAEKTGLDKSKYLIAFATVKPDVEDVHVISLNKVNKLIEQGFHRPDTHEQVALGIYHDGYGSRSWLIPKGATRRLDDVPRETLKKVATPQSYTPERLGYVKPSELSQTAGLNLGSVASAPRSSKERDIGR